MQRMEKPGKLYHFLMKIIYTSVPYMHFQASKRHVGNKNSNFPKIYPTTKQ